MVTASETAALDRGAGQGSGSAPAACLRPLLLGLALTTAYVLPYVVLGQDASVLIHDNLEPIIAIDARLASDGDGGFLLGGLPDESFALWSPVNPMFHLFLSPFWAYVARNVVIRLMAFLGAFALLRYCKPEREWLNVGIAVAFAWLPFWIPGLLSVALLPAVAFAMVLLLDQRVSLRLRLGALGIPALYPLFGTPAVTPFVLGALLVTVPLAWWYTGAWRWPALGFGANAAGFVAATWPLIFGVLLGEHDWHRAEFEMSRTAPFGRALWYAVAGQYHFHSLAVPAIWTAVAAMIGLIVLRQWPSRRSVVWLVVALVLWLSGLAIPQRHQTFMLHMLAIPAGLAAGVFIGRRDPTREPVPEWAQRALAALLGLLVATALWQGAFDAKWLQWLPAAGMFNYSRTYFFYPLIHFALLAVALWTLAPRGLPGKAAVASLVLLQCAQGMRHADWYLERDRLSYRQYVSREAFDQAEALMEVDRARVRVACVGFYPSRAHLNGFNTIGGYCPLYPARVKRRMRQVVEAELAKSDEVRRWFETNGHRCYVWSAELGWLHDVQCLFGTPPASIRRLEIDSAALARMGAHFVLSALPIDNAASIDLELVGVTDEQRQADHLRLWVYRTPMVRRAELSTADPGSEGE